jgi:hypothetical protein
MGISDFFKPGKTNHGGVLVSGEPAEKTTTETKPAEHRVLLTVPKKHDASFLHYLTLLKGWTSG